MVHDALKAYSSYKDIVVSLLYPQGRANLISHVIEYSCLHYKKNINIQMANFMTLLCTNLKYDIFNKKTTQGILDLSAYHPKMARDALTLARKKISALNYYAKMISIARFNQSLVSASVCYSISDDMKETIV